jgi:hypothetical protein
VHYNSPAEVRGVIAALDEILGQRTARAPLAADAAGRS